LLVGCGKADRNISVEGKVLTRQVELDLNALDNVRDPSIHRKKVQFVQENNSGDYYGVVLNGKRAFNRGAEGNFYLGKELANDQLFDDSGEMSALSVRRLKSYDLD